MLASLAMAAALPRAFTGRSLLSAGLVVGVAYAVQQIGRSVFVIAGLHGRPRDTAQEAMLRIWQHILAWFVPSCALAIGGGLVHGWARPVLWVLAVSTDMAGVLLGFPIPGLGRPPRSDRSVQSSHFAQRWQAFILIALGESILITGTTLSGIARVTGSVVAAFVVTFAGSVALWWLYFDRSAEASSKVIESSDDPGELTRIGYHLIHPVMVAGIIVAAAGDEKILSSPSAHASAASAWLILGGPALFVAGHTAFCHVIWRGLSWNRIAGIIALALLAATVGFLPKIALAACAAGVVAAVAAADRKAGLDRAGPAR
jgi:low temperature requirement protein LtrA